MGFGDRIIDAVTTAVKLNDRLVGISGKLDNLVDQVYGMDKRLVRVETTLELLTKGAFKAEPIDTTPRLEDRTKKEK